MIGRISKEFSQGKAVLSFTLIKFVGQTLALLSPLLIAKFLSPDLFGHYALAKTVIFFFSSLLIASAQIPFIVNANQERTKSGKINKSFSVQLVFLAFSIGIYLIIHLVAGSHLRDFSGITQSEMLALFWAYTGLSLYRFVGNLFLALNMRIRHSWIEFFFGLFSVLIVVLLYQMDSLTLNNIFSSYLASAILIMFFIPVFLRRTDFLLLRPYVFDRKIFRETIGHISWIMMGSVGVYLVNWGDNLILRNYVTIEDIGEYNLGYEVFKGMIMSTFILSSYFTPFIAANINNFKKISHYLFAKRWKFMILAMVGILILFFIAPPLMRIFYTSEYSQSIAVLKVLFVAVVFAVYSTFYTPILVSLKKFRFAQTVNIIQFIVNMLLDILLIPSMGIMGAAIGTVMGYCFKTVCYEWYFIKYYPHYSFKRLISKNSVSQDNNG